MKEMLYKPYFTLSIILFFLQAKGQEAYKIQGNALEYSYGNVLVKTASKWLVIDNTYIRFGIPTPTKAIKMHWLNQYGEHISSQYVSYGSYYQLEGLSLFGAINQFNLSQVIITGTQWDPGNPTSLFMVATMDTLGNINKIRYLSASDYYHPGSNPLIVSNDQFMFVTTVRTTGNQYLQLMDTSLTCYRVWSIQTPYADYGVISNLHAYNSQIVGLFSPSNINNGPTGCSGFAFTIIDTSTLSVVAKWHYATPTTPMVPRSMIMLNDSSWLVVGSALDTCTSSARERAFAMKLNPDGTVSWIRRFITPLSGREILYTALATPYGTYILGGKANTWSPTGDDDIFIIHIDSNGNIIKAISMGNVGIDVIYESSMLDSSWFIMVGATDNDINDGSEAFTPFVFRGDTSLKIPCIDMNWQDITSSLYVDSSYFDTTESYNMSLISCLSWQDQAFSTTTYQDSMVILQDSIIISIDTVIHAVCYGDSGYISVSVTGGQAPYSFMWNNFQSISDNSKDTLFTVAGSYNVFAVDSLGCRSDTLSVTINQPPQIIISVDSVKDVLCYGDSTGGAYISVVGGTQPYTVWWSTNDSASFISGVPAGTYTVYVLDSVSCLDSLTLTIDQPSLLSVTIDTTNIPTLQALASGGTPPYSYLWSTGDTSQVILVNKPGTYTVFIQDAANCIAIDSTTIIHTTTSNNLPEAQTQHCTATRANNQLKVQCMEPINTIFIYSLSGQVLHQLDNIHNTTVHIDAFAYPYPTTIRVVTIKGNAFRHVVFH